MARASQACSHPSCPNLQPCPEHTPPAWAGSTRKQRTVSGGRQQKRARYVMNRDQGRCHVCGYGSASEVDHCIPLAEGGADDISNLAAICRECHQKKTSAEAQRGRARAPRTT